MIVPAAIAVDVLAGWVAFAILLATMVVFFRGGGGTALASLEAANRVLEKQVQDLQRDLRAAQETIAELRTKTDISEALGPLVDAVTAHEHQAQERFTRTLVVLDLIAERLGSDPSAPA